jgi:hypothetical protein
MNSNMLSVGLPLLLVAVAALQAVQLHETRSQLDVLAASLQRTDVQATAIETDAGHDVASIESATTSSKDISVVTFSKLETRIAALEKSRPLQADSATVVQQEQQARQLADQVIAAGYLDDQQWQAVAADVEAMDKASNKAFWERTFAAIESGDLAVYSPDAPQ